MVDSRCVCAHATMSTASFYSNAILASWWPRGSVAWTAPLGASFIHDHVPPRDGLEIQTGDRLARLSVIRHFHKSESPGAARLPFRDEIYRGDVSETAESV